MTFSVVARCAESGMFGVAVTSSSPAVAARCSFARSKIGAATSQNITDPSLGPALLDAMEKGLNATDAMNTVVSNAANSEYRQLLAVDHNGVTAVHSGTQTLGVWSQAQTTDVVCGGNLLSNTAVPDAMVKAFVEMKAHIGERLIHALKAGLAAGGEAGPIHSAGLKIVDSVSWPVADLRIDWSDDCPIEALEQLWLRYKPQLDDYVQRAIDPTLAPSYGVPGDEG